MNKQVHDQSVEIEDKFIRDLIKEELLPIVRTLVYELRGIMWFVKNIGYVDPRKVDPLALDDKETKEEKK